MKRSTLSIGASFVLLFACAASAEFAVPFAPPTVLPMDGWGGDVTVGDIDADGDIDIIGTTRVPDFFWLFFNDGNGVFAPGVRHAAGNVPRAVIAADFNNDGDLDIATADEAGNSASVMLGNGAGGFALPRTFDTAQVSTDLACADFNADGLMDIVVTHRLFSDGKVSVLLNLGGIGISWQGFEPRVFYSIGLGSRSVHPADMNNDGNIDLVVTNRNDLTISVLLGNGDGTFNPQIVFPSGAARDAIVKDLNGNGLIDVAVADFTAGEALIYINLGNDANGWLGLAPFIAYPNGGQGSHGIDAGDIDLDNDIDLVVANTITASVSVMYNDGSGGFNNVSVMPDGNFSTAAISVGDFDADGDLDIGVSSTATNGSVSSFINLYAPSLTDPSDLNNDGVVDTADVGILLSEFGSTGSFADINCDGVVDTSDLGLLLGAFSSPPPGP